VEAILRMGNDEEEEDRTRIPTVHATGVDEVAVLAGRQHRLRVVQTATEPCHHHPLSRAAAMDAKIEA
jgi:hypothetical protein